MGVYLFSDLHGNENALNVVKKELEKKMRQEWTTQVICAGDLIDRGDKSAAVTIAYANLMRQSPSNYHFVVGNHEWLLLNWLLNDDDKSKGKWLGNGGNMVCRELSISNNAEQFVKSFLFLLKNGFGRIYIRTRHVYVVTHAGLTTKKEKEEGDAKARVWSRADEGKYEENQSGKEERSRFDKSNIGSKLDNNNRKYQVFGHSITAVPVIENRWRSDADSIYDHYETNKMFLLPIDAGLAGRGNGKRAKVALAHINHSTENNTIAHEVTLINTTGATQKYRERNGQYVYTQKVQDGLKELRESWKGCFPTFNEDRIKDCFLHCKSISWVLNSHWLLNAGMRRDFSTKLVPNFRTPTMNIGRPWKDQHALLQYIRERRAESGYHGWSWFQRKKYSREQKIEAAHWAVSYLSGTGALDDGVRYYDTLNDGRLKSTLQGLGQSSREDRLTGQGLLDALAERK